MIKNYIYCLFDPRTHDVKYVGETIDPEGRYKRHLFERENREKYLWISELALYGLRPGIEIVETCLVQSPGKAEVREREFLWMLYFTQEGYDLFNYEVSHPQIKAFLRGLPQNIFDIHKGYTAWIDLCLCYRSTPTTKMPMLALIDALDVVKEEAVHVTIPPRDKEKIERIRELGRARQQKRRARLKSERERIPAVMQTSITTLAETEEERRKGRDRQRKHRAKKRLAQIKGGTL